MERVTKVVEFLLFFESFSTGRREISEEPDEGRDRLWGFLDLILIIKCRGSAFNNVNDGRFDSTFSTISSFCKTTLVLDALVQQTR
jgi:hypothetical protein